MLGISWNRSPREAFLRLLHPNALPNPCDAASHRRGKPLARRIPHTAQRRALSLDSGPGVSSRDSQAKSLRMSGRHQRPQEGELEVLRRRLHPGTGSCATAHFHSLDMPLPEVPAAGGHPAQGKPAAPAKPWWEMLRRRRPWCPRACAGQRCASGRRAATPLHDSLLWPDLQAGQPVLCATTS